MRSDIRWTEEQDVALEAAVKPLGEPHARGMHSAWTSAAELRRHLTVPVGGLLAAKPGGGVAAGVAAGGQGQSKLCRQCGCCCKRGSHGHGVCKPGGLSHGVRRQLQE